MKFIMFIVILVSFFQPVSAVILYRSGISTENTLAPGDDRDSVWNSQGLWGNFLGTPISPNHFITAAHVGGSVGQSFIYNGNPYTTTGYTNSPGTDLRIWEVAETFSTYVPIYTKTDEFGKEMFMTGRGTQRGVEVNVSGASTTDLRGWKWGSADKVKRWGENYVEGFANSGSLLVGNFDSNSVLTEEAHLSVGDSGGAIFIKDSDDNTWKLAGINYAVESYFNYSDSTATEFNAAIFDKGGLYLGNDDGGYNFITDTHSNKPSSFYSTRISIEQAWIVSVVPEPSPWVMVSGALGMLLLVQRIRSPRTPRGER